MISSNASAIPERHPPIAGLHSFLKNQLLTGLVLMYQLLVLSTFVYLLSLDDRLFEFGTTEKVPFIVPYLVGLVYLTSSLWVFRLRSNDAVGLNYAIFASALAFCTAGVYDFPSKTFLNYMWTVSLFLAGGALLNLALLFPHEIAQLRQYPSLKWMGFIPALLLASLSALPAIWPESQPAFFKGWTVGLIFLGIALLFFLALTAVRLYQSPSPILRERAQLLRWGAWISFGLPCAGILFYLTGIAPSFTPFLLLPASLFPLVIAYNVLHYHSLNTDVIFRRGVPFALLSACASIGYALFVSGLGLIFDASLPSNHSLLTGAAVFLLAIALNPMRLYLQKLVDQLFFRGQTAYRERLKIFSRTLTQSLELREITGCLREAIQKDLSPAPLHIFIYDPLSDQYLASAEETQSSFQAGVEPKRTSDLRFPTSSPLVGVLANRQGSLILADNEEFLTSLQPDRARLALLGAQLFIPLPGRRELVGWLALGPPRSGQLYSHYDLAYLESLCEQAALTIERAQVVADLERRVRETNILARIAQGLNVTLAFDDILELIFAQTAQLIACRDFWITLQVAETGQIEPVFFLVDDERLSERENIILTEGQGLDREVIRERRLLLVGNYERECRARGVSPAISGLYAWIGVPLNAGSQTIGALSLASRDPTVAFTTGQAAILQAIADLAAGAIVKARLLEETDRRARQLASLNEISRRLTSTLETRPLLDGILRSATGILNCQAGRLFLVDRATNEVVFEATVGPVAGDLLGQRLPPGAGLVGKAVNTGSAWISNQAQSDNVWFDQPDQQTGFITHNLLVVPMISKDQVIGVIEVINKLDGSPFSLEDRELLSTFASQAAVAVENASLYTQTDQALAARVEELSVMQSVDRELNASLDLRRAMRITLEWALRHSRAEAGLIGLVRGSGVEVLAFEGYSEEMVASLTAGDAPTMPGGLAVFYSTISSGQIQVNSLSSSLDTPAASIPGSAKLEGFSANNPAMAKFLLPGAWQQIAIPICRETVVSAVLLLESRQQKAFSKETRLFLSRLSDHAAMAISNAQLYAAVHDANQAKSEFVSFVSHELKTPMTSIKGYADLLAAGAVGPVNEPQANFLNTIRNNVNRMADLVSDLNDVSRIEAGKLSLEFCAVQVTDLLNDVARSATRQLEDKNQELNLHIPADLPPIWGDRNRLIQVLTNLVSNANKYTPPQGKITLSAECTENHWDPKGPPQVIHLSVRDTGFGITSTDQKRIFQKFFRSEDQNIRNTPGTGLGLNITRHLVEIQGGRIWFESEPGKGSVFHFTTPVVLA